MSEYVYGTDEHDGHWLTGEEIVRCRDCWHSFADGTVCWNPMFVHSELFEGEWDDFPADVEPNGFCAWAVKRKKGGE